MQAIQSSPGPNLPGNAVKRINFRLIQYSEWDSSSVLTDLAKCCPNVQKILAFNPFKSFYGHLEEADLIVYGNAFASFVIFAMRQRLVIILKLLWLTRAHWKD